MSLRYVILRHEGTEHPHFDLMFETSAVSKLRTWRTENWPLRKDDILFLIADHRREYLEYEGPVSGDRGRVRRVQSGTYEPLVNNPVLFGGKIDGRDFGFVLHRDDVWTSA